MPQNYAGGLLSKWTAIQYTWGVVMVGNTPVYQVVNTTPSSGTGGYGFYQSRTFSGSRTPNFKKFRSVHGYLPTLNCSDTVLRRRSNAFTYSTVMSDGSGRVTYTKSSTGEGSHPSNKPLGDPALTALVNVAWSQCRQKVLAQDFNAPVFFAEVGKSMDMIVQSATRIYKAYLSFRRMRYQETAKILGLHRSNVHNTWLEYKYGWMPLLMDIHGAAKAMADLRYGPRRHRFSATKVEGVPVTEPYYSGKIELKAKVWVLVQLGNPTTDAANRIGLLNPLSVAWEIIPFSFVGDWFVNVGDCIQELTAFAGVTILDGGSSRSSVCNATYSAPVGQFITGSFGTTVSQQRSFSRTAGVQTIPVLRRKQDPLEGIAKSLTSLALIRQQLAKDTPPLKTSKGWR